MLRIRTEDIEKNCSLESKVFLISICSIRILNIFEVIAKKGFSKIAKPYTQGELSAGMFAFFLNRNKDDEVGGELSIGGVDPERYEGNFCVVC